MAQRLVQYFVGQVFNLPDAKEKWQVENLPHKHNQSFQTVPRVLRTRFGLEQRFEQQTQLPHFQRADAQVLHQCRIEVDGQGS